MELRKPSGLIQRRSGGGVGSLGYCRYALATLAGQLALSLIRKSSLGQEEFDRLRSLSYADTHVSPGNER